MLHRCGLYGGRDLGKPSVDETKQLGAAVLSAWFPSHQQVDPAVLSEWRIFEIREESSGLGKNPTAKLIGQLSGSTDGNPAGGSAYDS